MYALYSALLFLGALLSSPYWLLKAFKEKKYISNFRQRLGMRLPILPPGQDPLWIHAVSVGEVLAAKPLFQLLRARRPDLPVVVSTVTLTGQALAVRELPQAHAVFFFPFDFTFSVKRFLARVRPRAVLLMETELWPNFIRICARQHIPVLVANGRISDRSWTRYRRIRAFTSLILRQVHGIAVQTAVDAQRFRELGARSATTVVAGNLKYDYPPPRAERECEVLALIRGSLNLGEQSKTIVVGSSMKGEEAIFLDAFATVRRRHPEARLVLAPRHPERFDEVAALLAASHCPYGRRSGLAQNPGAGAEILLLDTIGELREVYRLAAVAVIGGSFLPFGGHNLLEPAILGKAIVFGSDMSNFKEMADMFLRRNAALRCTPRTLAERIAELLEDDLARLALGERAREVVLDNQGAAERTFGLIRPYL